MCKNCELQLGIAHSFKEQCRKANTQLKELLLPQLNAGDKPYVININNTEIDQTKKTESNFPNNIPLCSSNTTDEVISVTYISVTSQIDLFYRFRKMK